MKKENQKMIIDDINKANIEALKARNESAKTILSIVKNKLKLAEIDKRSKGETLQDADCVQIIQKTIKELCEEKENYEKVNNTQEAENIEKQKQVLANFLPEMLSQDKIKEIILGLDDKSVPNVMKYFKANYAGKVDMKDVNIVLKSL